MQHIERLFREYHTPIVRYLTRQLNDADLAEELAQETFVRAMRYGAARSNESGSNESGSNESGSDEARSGTPTYTLPHEDSRRRVPAAHKPVANERAWLFAVATNLLRDTFRRETRHRRRLLELHAEQRDIDPQLEELSAEDLREAELAREALGNIPERDRAALFMSQEGLSYPEIAAALGLSVQSVGTTLTRARKKVVHSYESLTQMQQHGGTNVAS